MIKFSAANTKLKKLYEVAALAKWLVGKKKIYSFDLLSGWACPQADICQSRAILVDGKRKIQDGPNTTVRCFSASQEVVYTNVYNLRKANFDAIRAIVADSTLSEVEKINAIARLIQSALPKNAGIVRIHVAGDFFNGIYFAAWLRVIADNPNVLFYAYTKALNHWIDRMDTVNQLSNFVLTASRGGRLDSKIDQFQLREAIIFATENEADDFNLEVDNDDSHACIPEQRNKSFALIIHGTQPAKPKEKKAKKKEAVTARSVCLVK